MNDNRREWADLHGSAPEKSETALLLVDVINDLEFPGAEDLLEGALPAAERLSELAERARGAGVPVIYANDNWGRWRSDFREVVRHCVEDGVRGEPIARLLEPRDRDYFVLKPRHSAFFATTLEVLLEHLGTERLVLAGFAADICVQLTAADAYLRGFALHVPRDCSASESREQTEAAMAWMERVLKAKTSPAHDVEL